MMIPEAPASCGVSAGIVGTRTTYEYPSDVVVLKVGHARGQIQSERVESLTEQSPRSDLRRRTGPT
jgi:hypothetical protein